MVDKERIRQAAFGRKPSDVDRQLKRRMVTYLVAIALGLAVWWIYGDNEAAAPPTTATTPLEPPLDVPGRRLPPLAAVDPARLLPVRDDTEAARAWLEPDARQHLLEQAARLVPGDLEQLDLQRGDHAALLAGPEAHRGRPYWAIGTLAWLTSDTVDGRLEVRGEITDAEGRPWAFLAAREAYGIGPGDVVRVSGFFFKVHDLRRPDRTVVTTPLLVGEELLRSSFRIPPVTSLDDSLRTRLVGVPDRDLSQAARPVDSPEFYELLSYVHNAAPEVLFPSDEPPPEVLPTDLLRDPVSWRARPVTISGVLIYMKQTPLGPQGENPLGEPFVWDLWISDNRAGDAGTVLVRTLTRPPVREKQIVDARGLFFRRYAFENRQGRSRIAPVILGREVVPFVPPVDTLTPTLVRIVLALLAGVLFLVMLGQWRDRRGAGEARKRRMRRSSRLLELPGRLNRDTPPPAHRGEAPGEPPAETGDAPQAAS